jgi:hypothetical protein
MKHDDGETARPPRRYVYRLLGKIPLVLVLLAVVFVLAVFIPAHQDMEIRKTINARVLAGRVVSDQLVAYRVENGSWPPDPAEHSRNGIEVMGNGLVRVVFTEPESIRGKWADLVLELDDGRYYRACRAPGIKSGRLPAWCRDRADAEEVRPAD